ncbi:MAG TPA: dolichyl-phosphate beta-glucosyltransferase [Solirubrobacteraceae bacterium]
MNSLAPHTPMPSPGCDGVPTPRTRIAATTQTPAVEIVIPVHNEQHILASSIRTLHAHLVGNFDLPFKITIVDNASSDGTLGVARLLSMEFPQLSVIHLKRKGRGLALRAAWGTSEADVVAYMDVDLATDLQALSELLEPLLQGRADVAIGTRLAPGARVERGVKRELISRAYNLLLHALLGASFSDAQCGFKAARRDVAQTLLEQVENNAWFFDTELLYLAQCNKLSIHEVSVHWVDDPDSRVHILATAYEDLRGIMRLRRRSADVAQPQVAAAQAHPQAAVAR